MANSTGVGQDRNAEAGLYLEARRTAGWKEWNGSKESVEFDIDLVLAGSYDRPVPVVHLANNVGCDKVSPTFKGGEVT